MSLKKMSVVLGVLLIASMVLTACPAPAPQVVEKVVTQVVEKTVEKVQTQIVEKTVEKQVVVTPTPAPATVFKSKDPTTFVDATFGEPETLDPALDYETSGGGVTQNVYETLVFYNKEKPSEFVPQLAEKWTVSDDGLTYTFNIRKGVKFHDGTEMTPSDVAYSFQRGLLQGGTASPQWLLTQPFFGNDVDDIAVLVGELGPDKTVPYDDRALMKTADPAKLVEVCQKVKDAIVADDAAGTVTMKLSQPWGPFLATIANTWGSAMSQKWVVANKGWDGSCDTWTDFYATTSDEDPFTSIAMGTGPFKFDHWTKGQEIVLVRNDDYWRKDPAWEGGPTGPAKLARVVIKQVDEWGTRFAMAQAGDADFVAVDRQFINQVDPITGERCDYNNDTNLFDACKPTNANQPLRLWYGAPNISRTDVFMNFKINVPEGGNPFVGSGKLDGNGIPADFFSDEHVRKAFNYCFDWDTYIKDALAGEAIQSTGIALPGMIGYEVDGAKYTYDLAKCEEEFKASTLKSEDGKSLWDTGFRMQIAYNTGNITRQTVAEILASDLAGINEKFQVEILAVPWATFLKNQRAKTLPLFISGWQEDIHDPHNWYVPYLTGTYGLRQSLPEESTKVFADLINKGVSAATPAERQKIYSELNQKVYELAPDIIAAIPTARHYEQSWVEGYYYNPIYPGFYFYPLSKQ
jgi:peptide/nickel transport system substrate-binding protein